MFSRLPNEALGRSPMSSCLREPRGFEARNSRYGLHPIASSNVIGVIRQSVLAMLHAKDLKIKHMMNGSTTAYLRMTTLEACLSTRDGVEIELLAFGQEQEFCWSTKGRGCAPQPLRFARDPTRAGSPKKHCTTWFRIEQRAFTSVYPYLVCGRHKTSLHIWPRYFSTYTSWPTPSRATNQKRFPLKNRTKTRFFSRYREFLKKFVSLVVLHTLYTDGTRHLPTYGQGISPHIETGGHAVQRLHCV
jgi:hypothetical protein